MKRKYFYLLALASMAFSACTKTELPHATPTAAQLAGGQSKTATFDLTLQSSDYKLLPTTDYPNKTLTIDDDADAQNYISVILNSKYPTVADGSTAAVTYTVSPLYFKPAADSLYSDEYYTLTNDDYLLLPGNKYTDFSLSQALSWLPYKYTSPVNNQLALISFTVYPSTQTPPPPYSYLYFQNNWRMIYTIQPAQYAAVGLGKYNQFTTSNSEASLVGMFNFFLKNDVTVMDTIKKGDYEFVSFNYYASGKAYQRVKPLQYNGTDFVVPYAGSSTINFIKKDGSWQFVQPLPVIAYTLTTADNTLVANSTAGTADARSNLAQYGDFDSAWTVQYMNAALIVVLTADFPTPQENTIYAVTFKNYNSPAPDPSKFQWDGTKWAPQQ